MLFAAWSDLDRALADVTPADAVCQVNGGSSMAWTLAHVTNGVDSWINVRFQGRAPHPLFPHPRFRFGGDGSADEWDEIRAGVEDVRSNVRHYLLTRSDADLDLVLPYDGSYPPFRERGIQLRLAILQNGAHHYVHLGEIVTKREWLGYDTGSFPGSLVASLA
jgi:hypothetical protein